MVSHMGWLYRRGKGTVLTPCTGSKISCLSIICCPNLQMMSRIFKHITMMVGLYQGRHYFSSTSKDNLGMTIMGVQHSLWVSGNQRWTVWTLREKTSYQPHKSAITEYNINWSHYIQLHKTNIPARKSRYMDHVIMDAILQQFQGEWAVCEQVIQGVTGGKGQTSGRCSLC